MKIVFLDAASIGEDVSLEPISSLGELVTYPFTSAEQVEERIEDCDILIINKVQIGRQQIDWGKSLKLICIAATGTNNVDLEYAASKGIPVKNVAGYSTESVAQVTVAMLLGLSCHTTYYDNKVKSGNYTEGNLVSDVTRKWSELHGRRLGIIGLGTIGSRVAALAEAFGMEVCYYATSGKPHSDKYQCLSLEELLKTSDFISVHAPLNEKTKNLITYNKLALCKKTAKVINIGRGGIINEEDLVKALNNNLIEGIGIDVFSKEPIPADSPYFNIEDKTKAILLPHIGWTSKEARTLLVAKIAENIKNHYSE